MVDHLIPRIAPPFPQLLVEVEIYYFALQSVASKASLSGSIRATSKDKTYWLG